MLNELRAAEIQGALERVMRRYVRADLLVIDDFAVLAMDAAQAKLAFQVISERYDHRRSTAITTNRLFKDNARRQRSAVTAPRRPRRERGSSRARAQARAGPYRPAFFHATSARGAPPPGVPRMRRVLPGATNAPH